MKTTSARFQFHGGIALLAICAGLLAKTAFAHDLWLDDANGRVTLQQGHKHSEHAGAETLDYRPDFVQSARCFNEAGETSLPAPESASPWRVRADCAAMLLATSSGYWTKTPWETRNAPKTGISPVIKSWRAQESLKRLFRWSEVGGQALGEGLEIVPQNNPFALQAGDKLTVQVLAGKQPLPNVAVAYGGDTRGATGPDGRIAIRLRHGGVQLISASREVPLNDGKADVLIDATTLQFNLAP